MVLSGYVVKVWPLRLKQSLARNYCPNWKATTTVVLNFWQERFNFQLDPRPLCIFGKTEVRYR